MRALALPLVLVWMPAWLPVCVLVGMLSCAPLRAQEGRFLSKAEAVAKAFPTAQKAYAWRRLLQKSEIKTLETQLRRRLPEGGYYVYLAVDGDGPMGLALLTAEIGKTQFFTFLIGTDLNRRVSALEVLNYNEPRGGEVRRRSFRQQFLGRSVQERLRVSREIENIPGATLSALAVTRGVRKALRVLDQWFDGTSPVQLLKAFQKHGREIQLPASVGRLHRRSFPAMGSVCALVVEGGDARQADKLQKLVQADMAAVESLLSIWTRDSELARAQARTGQGKAVQISKELFEILARAQRASRESRGAFDPTIQPALVAENEQAVQRARGLIGPDKLVLDVQRRTLRLVPGGALTTDAFAKGVAVDRAARILRSHGVSRGRVGFRSTFYLLGRRHRVPLRDGRVWTLSNCAVAASGNEHRRHILDPRTLTPAGFHGTVVVTAKTAFAADWLATAALVLGPERAPETLQRDGRRLRFFSAAWKPTASK